MQYLEVSCAVRRLLKSLGFKGLKKTVGGCGMDSSGSGYGQVAGCCENSNKALCSIKFGEFLDYLRKH